MAASFDCGRLSNKVFQISQGDIKQPGVGMDESTELSGYLQGTLLKIDEASNQSKSCIPGHADPDGHCLVHAISRCLTGIGFLLRQIRNVMVRSQRKAFQIDLRTIKSRRSSHTENHKKEHNYFGILYAKSFIVICEII